MSQQDDVGGLSIDTQLSTAAYQDASKEVSNAYATFQRPVSATSGTQTGDYGDRDGLSEVPSRDTGELPALMADLTLAIDSSTKLSERQKRCVGKWSASYG
jgi:hypothetical protein